MRKLILFVCLFSIFSCGNSQSEKVPASRSNIDTIDIYNDVVYSIDNRSNHLDLKSIESILKKKYFPTYEFSVELKDTPLNISIYSVKLIGDLPTAVKNIYTFIDARDQHLQFLLPIEYNQFYNIDNQAMIGGVYSSREFDYYTIYRLDGNFLKLVFDTRNVNGGNLKIGYYKDDECVDYIPDRLNFQYRKDEHEINFKGMAKVYCNEGKDRTAKDSVINENSLNVTLRFRQGNWEFDKAHSKYLSW